MNEVVTVEPGRIARVIIDNPPVNALNRQVREGLRRAIEDLHDRKEVEAVVLTCAGHTFVAGADITELGKPQVAPVLPDLVSAIEAAEVPWVAAISGTALGGGLELAMACHARVATASAKMGLPEVNIGILPGAGGTVRLPRLVSMARAIAMITGGKPLAAPAALEEGLIDRIVEGDLMSEATALAEDLSGQAPARVADRAIRGADAIDWDAEARKIAKKARGATAPGEALAALRVACNASPENAQADARARFLRLAASGEAAALRHLFFAERAAGAQLRETGAEPADLSHCGVVGGGTMGVGIAVALLLSGSAVVLVERSDDAATTARDRIANTLDESVKRGVVSAEKASDAKARLTVTSDYAALAPCGMVIEAVFEDMSVKRDVFARLDEVLSRDAIIGTNTSYLDVDALAAQSCDPSRVLGLHFFSPAHVMKLLEVVQGAETGARALATGGALSKRLRKIAVVSGVCDGFIGNRIMAAYRRDCEFMLEEGADPAGIDAAMRGFGFAMGIFEVQDLSGLDIAWAQRKASADSRDPDARYARIADRLCEAGRLGRKAGAGWYDYEGGEKAVSPEVARIIEEERERAGHGQTEFTSAMIMERIVATITREAEAILSEGIAASAADIDVVLCNGYGFPRHRGGPMFMRRAPEVEPA